MRRDLGFFGNSTLFDGGEEGCGWREEERWRRGGARGDVVKPRMRTITMTMVMVMMDIRREGGRRRRRRREKKRASAYTCCCSQEEMGELSVFSCLCGRWQDSIVIFPSSASCDYCVSSFPQIPHHKMGSYYRGKTHCSMYFNCIYPRYCSALR